jgi:alkylated DNA repair dioxygenase AlkB
MESPRIEGVTLIDAFVPEPSRLLERLKETVSWDTRMRARLTASFGAPYNYSGISYPQVPMHAELEALARAVERAVGHPVTNCLINFYPGGGSTMGFHSDSYAQLREGTTVSIVSLGGPRTLRFRGKEQKTLMHDVLLTSGSLLVMQQRVQEEWLHALPPEPGAAPRMSLTFRDIPIMPRGAGAP